jgi:hypothetical protein
VTGPDPVDPRRYQWIIGGVGLALLLASTVYMTIGGRGGQPGIPAGGRLRPFVAPLATSDLDLPANTHPRCDPRRPARRGLNVCDRAPIVLAFFVVGAGTCEREIDTVQRLAPRYPGVEFAAVAVAATRGPTARLVRRRHWTIPVAYDETGAVGQLYGVAICPLLELALRGGRVEQRLIGEAWERPARLAGAVRRLLAASGRSR